MDPRPRVFYLSPGMSLEDIPAQARQIDRAKAHLTDPITKAATRIDYGMSTHSYVRRGVNEFAGDVRQGGAPYTGMDVFASLIERRGLRRLFRQAKRAPGRSR